MSVRVLTTGFWPGQNAPPHINLPRIPAQVRSYPIFPEDLYCTTLSHGLLLSRPLTCSKTSTLPSTVEEFWPCSPVPAPRTSMPCSLVIILSFILWRSWLKLAYHPFIITLLDFEYLQARRKTRMMRMGLEAKEGARPRSTSCKFLWEFVLWKAFFLLTILEIDCAVIGASTLTRWCFSLCSTLGTR